MRVTLKVCALFTALCVLLPTFAVGRQKSGAPSGELLELNAKIQRFAPTVVTADTSGLSAGDRRALAKIVEAAQLLDPLFLRQVWSGNVALQRKLQADTTPLGRARLHYFMLNDGPWSQLDENIAFMPGVPQEKPATAAHYPDDMTKQEFESWVATLSEPEKQKATGFFYAVRRDAAGKLKLVPYSQEYGEFLRPAAALLREAAGLTTNATLKNFLSKRADAFLNDDYYESDVAWMDLDAPIDVTIGPYETYSDGLFGYKAAFEAYVTLRDEAESAKLAKFGGLLQDLENNLPIEPRYRNPRLGKAAPIRVVNVVYSSGEGNSGVQTAAFNLPNDERVVHEKGSKRVMLKNVQQAKFDKTLIPISRVVLSPADQRNVSFEAFFTHVLAHELMHGLGPHTITVAGRETSVRKELKDNYSAIEEAKADITGLWAMQYLIDKGVLDKSFERTLYTTFLASAFRSVRFGIKEAHGKGIAMQFNYLTDEGAFKYDPGTKTFSVVPARIKEAVRKLTHDLLTLEAEGSYEGAKAMLDKYGVVRPEMQGALDSLKDVPVDIEPSYPFASARVGR
ncbi:MAG: dipeptidyl-peptidase 3 family protein [Pyrinomonadaceae bacterium]